MSRALLTGVLTLALGSGACAARSSSTPSSNNNRLTSATVTFQTLQDGKDAKSAVAVQLVRAGNELAADATTSGTEFDDNSTAAPLVMSMKGPFRKEDAQSGQLRLRLTPDGDDTWTFNVRLSLQFADESQQNYVWPTIRLDEKAPDRTLILAGAQSP